MYKNLVKNIFNKNNNANNNTNKIESVSQLHSNKISNLTMNNYDPSKIYKNNSAFKLPKVLFK